MKELTKACSLTRDEIMQLIEHHGIRMSVETKDHRIERINYLNNRLKSFDEAPKTDVAIKGLGAL